MRRLEILDGMRGYFLVFMMLNHLTFAGGYLLVKINHGELGYVQDAQGFVFLSGLLVGMVYTGRMKKQGYAAGAQKVRKRAFELYRYAIGSIATVVVLALLMKGSQTYWEPWLWELSQPDPVFAGAAALLLYQPTYMDILPQYILYLLVSPPLIWLCMTGRWRTVVAVSALLWVAVQVGLDYPLGDGVRSFLAWLYDGDLFRTAFNIFAWQVVFMSGLIIGALTATGQIDWKKAMDPRRSVWAWTAFGGVLIFMAMRLGFTFNVMPEDMAKQVAGLDNRVDFSFIYLVNFIATGYLVAWTIMAGPRSENAMVRTLGNGLSWLFSLSFLRLLGRHSLQVYTFHVILVYLLKVFEHHHGPFTELGKTAIALAAVASLSIPALYRERKNFFGKRQAEAKA